MGDAEAGGDAAHSNLAWAARGARAALGVPAVVLFGSFIGFGAMAHDFGWPIWVAALSTALIWAAPAQLVLAGALVSGAGLAAMALAVSVSGVRLLPMVVSIMPILKAERTSLGARLLAAHYVAVTVWFEGLRLAPTVPRPARMPFFLGLANVLLVGSTLATAIGHAVAGVLPPALAVGLLGLTPMYFFLSLERGADGFGERLAMAFGFVLAPAIGLLSPRFDLIWAGLIGGTAAFAIDRVRRRRSPSA
ncbi:AzlC family ABC transporter permease [Hansschlegelia sp. KR7-227]|uniref:AzlC family ABC transporter permease n=1 Tax=Hansschlegelia sp. KR7-227 TaxID=3400914 RepID=UPI003C0D11BF